ncbi:O-antigen ligase family protein [Oricola sp.]|uniref:O-antigen ligase family protein n=1 Tax=Oricola sp. TaxID=1979950 RepID=UPI0025DF305D|nr:O-antigen ligase family protein [Oricola sp.]MCI5076797.1 O-antigen ligase family protein [Oricola sp.]
MNFASRLQDSARRLAGANGGGSLVLVLLCLVLVSCLWTQSDAYRYAAIGLLVIGATNFFLPENARFRTGWLGFAVYAWALHVALRYGHLLLTNPQTLGGQAEGIYVFVALCPAVGFAMFLNRARTQLTVRLIFAVSLACVIAALAVGYSDGGWNPDRNLHTNRIHAALATGFLVLATLARLVWLIEQPGERSRARNVEIALLAVLLAISTFLVVAWISKGVWLALAVALPVMAAGILWNGKSAARKSIGVIALATAAIVLVNLDFFAAVAGSTVEGVLQVAHRVVQTGSLAEATRSLETEGALPPALAQRLEIWSNALEIWRTNPWFGVGATWEDSWSTASFTHTAFNDNMHNGFLETGMRYGVAGLLFYTVLYGVLGATVVAACRRGLIHHVAANLWFVSLLYFLVTLLTNSNERLPHGESFMLVLGATGFWMQFALQDQRARDAASQACSPEGAGR